MAIVAVAVIVTDGWALRHFGGAHAALDQQADSYLNAIACPSAAQCWAVGQHASAPGGNTDSEVRSQLIRRETGGRWERVAAPKLPGSRDALEDVTCPAVSDCWAVGGSAVAGPPVIEHWSGGSWRLAASPAIRGGQLNSVSCASPDACWALGGTENYQGTTTDIRESWNGRAWRRFYVLPGGLAPRHISCAPAGYCVAAGLRAGRAAAERFSRGRWSPVPLPGGRLAGAIPSFLSCAARSRCLAVFQTSLDDPISATAAWNGSGWVTRSTRLPRYLVSLSCTAASGCWLTGTTLKSQPLLLAWRGTRWAPADLASPRASTVINGFACGGACWAVGGAGGTRGDGTPYSKVFTEAIPAAGA